MGSLLRVFAALNVSILVALIAYVAHHFKEESNTSLEGLDLRGKRVLVCGASQGIGRDIVRQYVSAGASVAMAARSVDKMEAIREQLRGEAGDGAHLHVIQADLRTDETAHRVVDEAVAALGGLDVLVLNHASYTDIGAFLDRTDKPEFVQSMFEVNTFSYIYLAAHAIPHLAQTEGQVIVVSSISGKVGMPNMGIYSANKHALQGFFTALQHELVASSTPVSVTVVVIGMGIATEGVEVLRTKMKAIYKGDDGASAPNIPKTDPAEAARAIIRAGALKKGEVSFPLAQVLAMRTVYSLLTPRQFKGLIQALRDGSLWTLRWLR